MAKSGRPSPSWAPPPARLFVHWPAGRAQGGWKMRPRPGRDGPPLQVTSPAAAHSWGRGASGAPGRRARWRGGQRGVWAEGAGELGREPGAGLGGCAAKETGSRSQEQGQSPAGNHSPSLGTPDTLPTPAQALGPRCQGEALGGATAQERGAQTLPEHPRTHHRNRDRQMSTAGYEEPVEISNKWIPDAGKTVPTLAQE